MRIDRFDGESWGFYKLYSIDVGRQKRNADSNRGKTRGLNSPHGRRGAICEHFGWTYDYLTNGIAWSLVQRMMIDAPSYESEKETEDYFEMTEDNLEEFVSRINSV